MIEIYLRCTLPFTADEVKLHKYPACISAF